MAQGPSFDPSTVPVFSNVLNRPEEAERSPFRAGLVRVGAELSNNIPLIAEKALGTLTPEKEASYQQGLQRGLARSEQLLPGGPVGIDQVRSVGDVGSLIKESLLYSLPQTAAGIGGAVIARKNPLAGFTVAGTPFYIGSNITRATEGGTKHLENDALARSVATAPFQAFADVAAERFLPFAGSIFGKAAARQTGGFLKRTGKSILKAGAAEAVTETAQQAGERFAAGLVLTNRDAAREYVQSFGTAFFVGGAMGSLGGVRSANVSSPSAPTEELQQVVDQYLQLPPPGQSGLVAPNARMDVDPQGNATVVPDQGEHVVVNEPSPGRPFAGFTDPELQSAVNALRNKELNDEQQRILQLAQAELEGRSRVNNPATSSEAQSQVEAVEPSLTEQSGGEASNSGAPASIPWTEQRDTLLKGVATRKSYSDAENIEDLGARLKARLEAGSTAKSDFILAERLGVDTNAPAAPVETAESRVQTETGAQAPVATDTRATPAPAAPASQGGGDTSVDPEFIKYWNVRKKGKDKAVRALKPTSYEDLDNQIFRELGEPRNTETLFSKSDHLEQLAADREILDKEGNLTEKGMNMAVAQGIVPPTINEAQSQEIMKRRMVASQNSGIVSEAQWQQQDANAAIEAAQLPAAKFESDITQLKQMVRDGDIEGAMMRLEQVKRGETIQERRDEERYYKTGHGALANAAPRVPPKGVSAVGGIAAKQRAMIQEDRDRAQARKVKNRAEAEAAIQKFELQQSIDAAEERGLIDRKQKIKLVGQLRQGRLAEVANAVPVVKADPLRATPVAERMQRRQALVSDLHDTLDQALREAEVSELEVDGNGVLRQQQAKVARRDFLAGVAASAAVGLPTQAKSALSFTPLKPSLKALLDSTAYIEGGGAVPLLDHIKRNSSDAGYRLLAAKLLRGDWSKVSVIKRGFVHPYERGGTTLNDDGSSTVDIYTDGLNEQTILHELIHAYVQQRWGALWAYLPENELKLKADKDRGDTYVRVFQSVWERIGYALKQRGLVQKALDGSERDIWALASYESPDEMLSWVLTNPDAQAFLKSIDAEGNVITPPKPKSQMTLWDKIVEFFAQLFGSNTPKMCSALDDVLAAGYGVIDAGANVEVGDFNVKLARDVARRNGRMQMAKGPPRSAADFSTVAQSVTSKLSQAADNYIDKNTIAAKSLKTMVGWMPLTHIVKRFGETFPQLQLLFDAHADRRATTAVFAHLYDIPKNIGDRLMRTKAGQSAVKTTNEIMELTAWDIDPTKSWEENDHLHEYDNAARLKELWTEGNRKYNLLKKDGQAELYDTYRQLNELDRFSGMALAIRQMVVSDPTLKSELPFFEDDPVAKFRNDTSLHNPAAAKRYWRDVLDRSVKEAGDYIEDLRGTTEEKASSRLSPLETYLKDVKKSIVAMEQAPYFHLGRHGNFFVSGQVRLGADKKADGDAIEHVARELEKIGITNARISRDLGKPSIFLRVEKRSQRDQIAQLFLRLQDEGWLNKDAEVLRGDRDMGEWLPERIKEEVKKFANAMQAQFEITEDMSDREKEAMRALRDKAESVARDVYLEMLPDSAMSKVLTHRESKPGYDKDMSRNFAFRYNIGVNSLASMAAAPYIDEAFQKMRGHVNEAKVARLGMDVDTITTLYAEMAQREENLSRMAGDNTFDQWRAMTHAYFLGLSPSYFLVNLTQVPVMLWPELAKKHGFVGAAKAMAKVTPLAIRIMRETFKQGQQTGGLIRAADTMITPEVLRAAVGNDEAMMSFLQHMVGSGIIDIGSSARELGLVAEGKADARVQKVLRYAAAAGLYSETTTRLIAALAARELHKGDFASTVDYAKDVVRESMFEYSTYNTPRHMGKMGLPGKFTPVMTQFMQYSTQLTFKLYRELHDVFTAADPKDRANARKFLLTHLTVVTALAGTLGLPFATVAAAVLEKLVDTFGDDDEPYDATAAMRNFTADIFGEQLGDMISRGIPRAGGYGFDLSQRVGEQNLMPFSQWLTDKRKWKDASAEAALRSLGAPVSMASSVYGGFEKIADGDFIGGLADAMPSAFKGPTKAYQMYEDGYKDTLGNKLPMSPNATSYMLQLAGLNPAVKAQYAEERGDQRARDTVLTQRAGVLRTRMVNAVIDQDRDTMKSTWQQILEFNKDHPGSKFIITPQEIENSIRRRMKLQATSERFNLPIGVKPEDQRARELTRYSPIEYTAQ